MLKKAAQVVTGNALGFILSLVRNLLVARLVSPENYGIASSFALAMSLIEMMSYLGFNQLMVVDKDGDEPHFQAAMQGFQILRGCFSSVMLFIVARPYASFLHIEHAAWAFEVLAIVPFINGFQHCDPFRARRHLNFTPMVLSTTIPALIAVIVVWPMALAWGDYRIMLGSIIVQQLATVLITHMTAERPYRATLDRALMRHATAFGWPILLNGILLFGVFNGERLIVGRELGMVQFAYFSMAFTLTLTPTLVLASSGQSLFLPQLTRALDNPREFQRLSDLSVECFLVIGLLLILGSSLVGGPLVHLLAGKTYLPILSFLVPMAVMQAIRVAKTGSAVVALSIGKTGNAIIGNLPRVASLPISYWIALNGGTVLEIIWVALAAEVVGFAAALWVAIKGTNLTLGRLVQPMALSALTCVLATLDALRTPPLPGPIENLHPGLLLVTAAGLAALLSMTELRAYTLARWRAWRR